MEYFDKPLFQATHFRSHILQHFIGIKIYEELKKQKLTREKIIEKYKSFLTPKEINEVIDIHLRRPEFKKTKKYKLSYSFLKNIEFQYEPSEQEKIDIRKEIYKPLLKNPMSYKQWTGLYYSLQSRYGRKFATEEIIKLDKWYGEKGMMTLYSPYVRKNFEITPEYIEAKRKADIEDKNIKSVQLKQFFDPKTGAFRGKITEQKESILDKLSKIISNKKKKILKK